ncbi:MAG: site-specific integrase, partial [Planctomycetes bacterium]|nr:site-specific integrase [Planctomycetota bacterium]
MLTIQDALDRFLVQLDADGRSPHTIGQYRRHVRLFSHWAATDAPGCVLADIDEQSVARFFTAPVAKQRAQGGPRKATAANALRTSVRVFFGFAHEAGWIPRNPARLLRRAICSPPPPKAFSDDDL